MRKTLAALLVLAVPLTAFADDPKTAPPEVIKVAETYLKALTGDGDESGKELLLGGATMNAQLFTLENYTFKSKEPVQKEEGDLSKAAAMMNELDKASREALNKMLNAEQSGDDLTMHEVSQDEATKLMGATRASAAKFVKTYPTLAYVTRVGKEVYWHPKNPMRPLLQKAGKTGKYQLELHKFLIVSKEGPRQTPREWPLRVLRFKAGKIDTGWKILPASDWNAE